MRRPEFIEGLARIDRRIIFVVAALVVLAGAVLKPIIPLPASEESQKLYAAIEEIPSGGVLIAALDYGPSSADELDAMARATLHHAFSRNLRVLGVCFDQQGVTPAGKMLDTVAASLEKTANTDYVFLGFKPDITAAVDQMGKSITDVFPTMEIPDPAAPPDAKDAPKLAVNVAELPVMQGVANFSNVALAVEITGGRSFEKWVDYGNARYGLKLAAGATGAVVTALYPFLGSGQILGLLRGTRGASDYENLVNKAYPGLKPDASAKMSVQFFVHLMVIGFILLANIGYWTSRGQSAVGSKQ